MNALWRDVRHALRILSARPGFAVLVIVTLGLGIGATTAIYGVANAVLVRPLPFREFDRIVAVYETHPRAPRFAVAPANFLDWQAQNRVFQDLAAIKAATVSLVGGGEPARLVGQRVSASFFRVLQVNALAGRTLVPDDERPDAPPVAVLSYGLWQRQFGGDRAILNRAITLDGTSFIIVGILPASARWLTSPWDPQDAEIFLSDPFASDPRDERGAKRLQAIARLAPGVTLEQAQREMKVVAARLQQAYPATNKSWSVGLRPLQEDLVQFVRQSLLLLLGASGLLLLIACVNVANLLLVHATARRHEMAVRASLGASRSRIARQFLTETAVLATLGGLAGLVVASIALPGLVAIAPQNLPRLDEARIDWRVFAFTMAVSLVIALAAGLAPAIRGSGGELVTALKDAGDRFAGTRRTQRGRLGLVAAQVALGLVLLCGAGLMAATLVRLSQLELGFDPTSVVDLQVALPRTSYAVAAGKGTQEYTKRFTLWRVKPDQLAFVDDVVERVRAIPGVESAGAINYAPATGGGWGLVFKVAGRPELPRGQWPNAMVKYVTPDYFRTMRVSTHLGREFTSADREGSPNVAIVNDALAAKYLGRDSLAERLLLSDGVEDPERSFQIVGVVADEKQSGLDALKEPLLYLPYRQQATAYVDWQIAFRMRVSFVARTRVSPSSIAGDLRRAVWAVDPKQPIARLQTMESHIAESLAQRRLYAILLAAFSMLGVGLASLGIYGVTTYAVSRRTHEIGLRVALGAQKRDLVRLVLTGPLVAAITGVTLGLVGAYWLTRLLASQLYGVTPTDPIVLTATTILMVVIAVIAALVPARRAMRVDPMVALRSE